MSADTFSFQSSLAPQVNDFIMASRQFTWIGDSNGTSYPSGQIVFDLAGLSNSGKFIDWSQTNLVIPLVLNVQNTSAVAGGFGANVIENAFCASFKNGFHHLIHSMSVEITNNQVVSLTPFSNLDINFRLLTKSCYDDMLNFAPSFQFSKDNAESINYSAGPVAGGQAVAQPNGPGEYNNKIAQHLFNPTEGYMNGAYQVNDGRLKRMNVTSYDATQASQPIYTTQQMCNQVGKASVVYSAQNITYYALATIPLRMLHDIFRKLPLTMGMYVRLTINTNTACMVTIGTTPVNGQVPASYTNNTLQVSSQNSIIPFMLSPVGAGGGFNCGASTQITATLGIARGYQGAIGFTHPTLQQCRIYACMYDMSPSFASTYLSNMSVKKILYNDILSFQSTNIPPNTPQSQILTNGISRPRYLIGIPQLASAFVPNGGTGTGYGPMASPFSSAPGTCCPQARLINFNVLLSGTNLYQNAYTMNFESFLQELRQCNCLNGGLDLGISNGLISQSDWENGYGFVFVNLDRKDSQANDDISRTIQVQYTNGSNVPIDYFWIVGFERTISINTSTGSLVI